MTETSETLVPPAPQVNALKMEDPWTWLAKGWADIKRSPLPSLIYGIVFVAAGAAITGGLWWLGLDSVIPAAAASFALVGPVLAIGLYEISRRHERGAEVSLSGILKARPPSLVQFGFVAFFLMFGILVWMRIATLLVALFLGSTYPPLPEFMAFLVSTKAGLSMLVIGSITGGVIAFFIYALSVVSMPLLLERDVDGVTAIISSFNTVRKNFAPMMLWAWLIASLIALGFVTAGVGLIVIFPLLGHATWHAYRAALK